LKPNSKPFCADHINFRTTFQTLPEKKLKYSAALAFLIQMTMQNGVLLASSGQRKMVVSDSSLLYGSSINDMKETHELFTPFAFYG
jgi:hypothetical protein